MDKGTSEIHRTWHKFSKWLSKNFGKDLESEKVITLGEKEIRYREINELELSRRLVGYEVQEKVKRYVSRCCPEIKIVGCDDDYYASSILVLVPHPAHGITIIFIPQCTTIQNRFFLYKCHFTNLMKALSEMGEDIYTDN